MNQTTMSGIVKKTDLLTTEEAAVIVGVKPGTLVNWRCTKKVKIPYVKIGSKVFYREKDINDFIEQKLVA